MYLSHIGLVVGNIEKAAKFYTDKLGLSVKYGAPKTGDPVSLDLGNAPLILTPKNRAQGRPAGEFSFCFEFPDDQQLQSKVDELKGKGLYPVIGPYRNDLGQTVVLYAGSDNEVIEFFALPGLTK